MSRVVAIAAAALVIGFGAPAAVSSIAAAEEAAIKIRWERTAGSAIRKNGKTIYYGRVPKTCPKGGFPGKAELTFAGLGGLTQQTVTKTLTVPCPKH